MLTSYWMCSLYIVTLAVIVLRIILRFGVKRCTSKVNMSGKVVIVTGANSGIGFYTALDLARRGARVILACRHEARGIRARDQIIAATLNSNVVYKHLDMASLYSVKKFCEDITRTEERVDVLVNNAGVYALGDRYTDDGIVETMQVNYFSVFLLTDLLLPMIKAQRGRIVNVGSLAHYIGDLKPDHINKKGYYSEMITYANSKFCIMAFTVELARRLRGSGVTVNAVHPGVVKTNITDTNRNILLDVVFWVLVWVCYRTAEEGAQSVVHCCVAEECAQTSGKFFVDCAVWRGPWKSESKIIHLNLWNISEKLLKYKQTNMKV
ncbi:hypothetical protein ABMA27_001876 [Loxostege sticticalis]|uniref:Uncharacterized protein n=1 Tax=Loxostege sticticalis TaxID=481309 RepID=A0ABR3HVT4_LOXSC